MIFQEHMNQVNKQVMEYPQVKTRTLQNASKTEAITNPLYLCHSFASVEVHWQESRCKIITNILCVAWLTCLYPCVATSARSWFMSVQIIIHTVQYLTAAEHNDYPLLNEEYSMFSSSMKLISLLQWQTASVQHKNNRYHRTEL